MKTSVYRKERFNAAHRLHNPALSDEQNKDIFGKCNNANFHGHNYVLEVWIEGAIDTETGYVIDLKIVKDLIKNELSLIEQAVSSNVLWDEIINIDC